MPPTSTDAVSTLAALLKADPPASMALLEPVVVTRLTDAVAAESIRQEAAIEQAVDDALRLVPRPFRGIVKRLIRP